MTLTAAQKSPILQPDINLFGEWLMRVKIYTEEKCPVCGSAYTLTFNGMRCAEHQKCQPHRYYLQFNYRGQRVRLFSWQGEVFERFKDVVGRASIIEEELERDAKRLDLFRIEQYLNANIKANGKYVFSSRFEKWMEGKAKELKPSAHSKIRLAYGQHYSARFGRMDIRIISTDDIQTFYEALLDYRKVDGAPYSNKTIKNLMDILHVFFTDMHRREAISRVPKFPRIKVTKRARKWITREQQLKVMQEIPAQHHPIFMFMFNTGVRVSEARALQWSDIDQGNGLITIRHNFSERRPSTTKTDRERIVPITQDVARILASVPKALRSEYIFNHRGRHYSEWLVGNLWRQACTASGIEHVRLYDGTRHSFATQFVVANKGAISTLQNIMGHTDLRTTMEYTHVSVDAMRDAMER